ncbi:MAG: sugar transferase [Clostridia bacterium]|nr:sugar transferase [Clostridia bacterium]
MLYPFFKRFFDIVFSALLIVVLALPMLIVGLCIIIESRGGALFKQERLGKSAKVFKIYKFRSMCVGAESKGSGVYSASGDPRVTRVGKIIRATSLDELPQLFNIFLGQMSFIGPRPVLTYHPWPLDEYTEEQKKRFNVRPGITGLAQINGRKNTPWVTRIRYDLQYVNELSLLTDVKIMCKTVAKVFKQESNLSETDKEGKAIPTNINTEKEGIS